MNKNQLLLFTLFFLAQLHAHSQACNFVITGTITDESTEHPLPFATVYIEETQTGAVADEEGNFIISNICTGNYHLRLSHIGCETQKHFLKLTTDTNLHIHLHHHTELMSEVTVHGKKSNITQISETISKEEIARKGFKSLSDLTEGIEGVSSLKTGANVSKPIIHGLSGNRVDILNNGLVQAGQQWGNDHAPEIDPFVANHISVIKGANVLAYPTNSIGGLILIEPAPIPNEPHLHGSAQHTYSSNGKAHTSNLQLENFNKLVAWRLTATNKKQGDLHTPNYFLSNTGKEEKNLALQLEKKILKNWKSRFYYSYFSSEMGILRAAHIGNLTDLQNALNSTEPFYTSSNFTYQINPPKQNVVHHLFKLENTYYINNKQLINLIVGKQFNQRKEFDIRRGGRSEIPALNIEQISNTVDAHYLLSTANISLKTGIQLNQTLNENLPETGILPLIPNYVKKQGGAFFVLQRKGQKLSTEIGARLDLQQQNSLLLARTYLDSNKLVENTFTSKGLSFGLNYNASHKLTTQFNIGFLQRPPAINELYSFGLHQGVSGFEQGNEALKPESGFKFISSTNWHTSTWLFTQITAYVQPIHNFIYLNPSNDFILTIRGAYPSFTYQQTNALLLGSDIMISIEPTEQTKLVTKYAFVKGQNTTDDVPLLYIPPSNISTTLQHTIKNYKHLKNTSISVTVKNIWQQKRLLPEQDFTPAPPSYFLLDAYLSTDIELNKYVIKLGIVAENILNKSYRNYLNRQRYFADEVGRNISFKIGLVF